MKKHNLIIQAILFSCLFFVYSHTSWAQEIRIDEKLRDETVTQIAQMLVEKYVLPDIGDEYAGYIMKKLAEGEFNTITNPYEFAEKLTSDIKQVKDDKHLKIKYDPQAVKDMRNSEKISDEERERNRERWLRNERKKNFGFQEIKILAGNIGYLKLNQFASHHASETAVAALNFLANTDAIIIDIRNNGGGSSDMIQMIGSYFLEDQIQFSSIYNRAANKLHQIRSLPYVPGKRLLDTDLYILISKNTFSAAEAFAYDMKHLKRATIIGEKSPGGAHITNSFVVNDYFIIYLPFAKAISPITNSNWEGEGVDPDIEVTEEEALHTAQRIIINNLMGKNPDKHFLNNLGYALLKEKNTNLAIDVFERNIEIHPTYANGYDSLGEAYMIIGDYESSLTYYRKALEMNPDLDNAKSMIEKIEEKLR